MIYLDSCALVKFIRREQESDALRDWRGALPPDTELICSELALLEISRTLLRSGADPTRVPYYVGQAVRGITVIDLTRPVLARARGHEMARLGSLDAIHLATADPFRAELTDFVTYDAELAGAAEDLGLAVTAPS